MHCHFVRLVGKFWPKICARKKCDLLEDKSFFSPLRRPSEAAFGEREKVLNGNTCAATTARRRAASARGRFALIMLIKLGAAHTPGHLLLVGAVVFLFALHCANLVLSCFKLHCLPAGGRPAGWRVLARCGCKQERERERKVNSKQTSWTRLRFGTIFARFSLACCSNNMLLSARLKNERESLARSMESHQTSWPQSSLASASAPAPSAQVQFALSSTQIVR